MHTPLENSRETLDAIIARAETDAAFRADLLADPRTAIHAAFGVRIPESVRIRFIEREADVDALIVLPDLRTPSATTLGDELSDQDLEQVTGGAHAQNAQLAWKRPIGPKPAPSRTDLHSF